LPLRKLFPFSIKLQEKKTDADLSKIAETALNAEAEE
jgi:hypothetical protein